MRYLAMTILVITAVSICTSTACRAAGFTEKASHGHLVLSQELSWCVGKHHRVSDFHASAQTTATHGWTLVRKWHRQHSTRATYHGKTFRTKITRTVHAIFVKHVGSTTYTKTLFVRMSTF
jgi:hypothetical protein